MLYAPAVFASLPVPGPCSRCARGDAVVEAADAAVRSAVVCVLSIIAATARGIGIEIKRRSQGPRRADYRGGWSSSIWWRRRRSGAPATRSTSSSPRRTTRGGWTFTQSPASPSTCCVPAAPTASMCGARARTVFPFYSWPRTTSPPAGRRLSWRCWRRSSRPSGLYWVFQT